ncbi:eukaryotic translation initiation factor 4B-like isoform X3 [Branchiostoma lanceolatum]|uniref:eukaryotic translation initiation factor 4B-like isoform X3 n=1 Tax=Branchiostoma lanceolatum TaxID=7740 RepID=UPI003452E8CB
MAAAAGKKKKKAKGQTVSLNDFLGDAAPPSYVMTPKSNDWADETEGLDYDTTPTWSDSGFSSAIDRAKLPTAPRSARMADFDASRIPDKPPFTAFLGNLSYDVDEEAVERFFRDMKLVTVRLPRDGGDSGRLKGFGYAEFEDKDSLLKAINMNNEKLLNRQIRVDVADQTQQGGQDRDSRWGDRDGKDRSDGRDRALYDELTAGDWRKASSETGILPPARPGGSFSDRRDRDRDMDRGSRGGGGGAEEEDRTSGDWRKASAENGPAFSRFGDRESGTRDIRYSQDSFGERGSSDDRGGYDRGGFGRDRGYDDRDRGFGSRDRGYNDRGYSDRGRYDDGGGRRSFGSGYRDDERGGGYDDYGRGSYGRRDDRGGGGGFGRDFGDRYGPRRDDRFGDRDGFRREEGGEPEKGPAERPKLQLAKRTKPVESAPPPAQAKSSSNIFGGAKPVDTAAKEREIEEKLARQKVEEEERYHQERASRPPPRERMDSGRTRRDSENSATSGRSRHNSSSSQTKGPRPVPVSSHQRHDSERSADSSEVFQSDESPRSPKREDAPAKAVPAPPPKDNPWAKRSEPPQNRDEAPTSQPRVGDTPAKYVDAPPPKENAWSRKGPTSPTSPTSPDGRIPGYARDARDSPSSRGPRRDSGGDRGRVSEDDSDLTTGDAWGRGSGGRGGRGGGPPGSGRPDLRRDDRRQEPRDGRPARQEPAEPKKYVEPPPPVFSQDSKFAALLADEDGGEASD